MTSSIRRHSRAGGSLLAISIIAGTVAGTIAGESSVGFLVGVGAGLMMLAFVWLSDRRAERRSADAAPGPDHAADHGDR